MYDQARLAVLHNLMTAGTFLSFYEEVARLKEFTTAALYSVPGVAEITIDIADDVVAVRDGLDATSPPASGSGSDVLVALTSGDQCYGSLHFTVTDADEFAPYRPALFNFVSSLSMRIEAIRHRAFLESEIARKTSDLALREQFLSSIFESTGDPITVIGRDFSIVRANAAARALLACGVEGASLPCHGVFSAAPNGCTEPLINETLASGEPRNGIVAFPTAADPRAWYAVSTFPIFDDAGTVEFAIESGRDITALKELKDQLTSALEEKELLLREVHHRVKNNLNVAISVLQLQFGSHEDPGIAAGLASTVDRLNSMALVHEHLYRSESQRSIDAKTFLTSLVADLNDVYGVQDRVTIDATVKSVSFGLQRAVPLGLIMNEILANALKYAFPEGMRGAISVEVAPREPEGLTICVCDDGVGLPPDFAPARSDSLGMVLIHGLVQQLGGTVTISPARPDSDRPGVCIEIVLPQSDVP